MCWQFRWKLFGFSLKCNLRRNLKMTDNNHPIICTNQLLMECEDCKCPWRLMPYLTRNWKYKIPLYPLVYPDSLWNVILPWVMPPPPPPPSPPQNFMGISFPVVILPRHRQTNSNEKLLAAGKYRIRMKGYKLLICETFTTLVKIDDQILNQVFTFHMCLRGNDVSIY